MASSPHFTNIFSRDINQFRIGQGTTTIAYYKYAKTEQRRNIRNWVCPTGFSLFFRSASLLLERVVSDYAFLVAPSRIEKRVENAARIYL